MVKYLTHLSLYKVAHKLQALAIVGTQGRPLSFHAVAGLVPIYRCDTTCIFCRPFLVPGWTTDILLIHLVSEPFVVILLSLLQLHNCNN